jgi:hypothetical protein
VVDVVVTASAELIALSPLIFTEAGLNDKVGKLVAPLGLPVTAADSATAPVKPFDGFTLTASVFPLVAPGAMVRVPGLALRPNAAAAVVAPLTSARSPSVWTNLPVESCAVISTSFMPFAAEALAFSVTMIATLPPLVSVADAGPHVIPDAAVQLTLTVPAKPFTEAN